MEIPSSDLPSPQLNKSPGRSGFAKLLGLVALLLVVCSASFTPAAAQSPTCPDWDETCVTGDEVAAPEDNSPGGFENDGACYTCELFIRLEAIGKLFVAEIYDGIAPELRSLLAALASIYIMLLALMAMARRISGSDLVKKLTIFFFIAFLADVFLANGYSTYDHWIVAPMLSAAASYADFIISTAQQLQTQFTQDIASFPSYTVDSDAGMFARLMAVVEAQVFGFIRIAYAFVNAQGGWFANPAGFVLVMVLILAYLFVLLIFTAFMVEALFKILSMGFIAPVLIVFAGFPLTRAITWAAVRILLGACLTVVFASGALGFTAAIVNDYINSMGEAFYTSGSVECTGLNMFTAAKVVAEEILQQKPCIRKLEIWSKDFLIFYVIGFISILLHLQSKSLASNLSGANDGVGPAAATVAAGKTGVGLALAAGGAAAFGQAGLRGFASGGGAGQLTANVAQQGLVGSMVDGFRQATGSNSGAGPNQYTPGTPPQNYSTGASPNSGGGGNSLFGDRKQMQEFAKILGDTINGSSSGPRNRRGSE